MARREGFGPPGRCAPTRHSLIARDSPSGSKNHGRVWNIEELRSRPCSDRHAAPPSCTGDGPIAPYGPRSRGDRSATSSPITIRIFSSAENRRRVSRRTSRTTFSAKAFVSADSLSFRNLKPSLGSSVRARLTAHSFFDHEHRSTLYIRCSPGGTVKPVWLSHP